MPTEESLFDANSGFRARLEEGSDEPGNQQDRVLFYVQMNGAPIDKAKCVFSTRVAGVENRGAAYRASHLARACAEFLNSLGTPAEMMSIISQIADKARKYPIQLRPDWVFMNMLVSAAGELQYVYYNTKTGNVIVVTEGQYEEQMTLEELGNLLNAEDAPNGQSQLAVDYGQDSGDAEESASPQLSGNSPAS